MFIIVTAIAVIFGCLLLCCYRYRYYGYRQSKIVTERQNTNKVLVIGFSKATHKDHMPLFYV
jgi:hypothetical protein